MKLKRRDMKKAGYILALGLVIWCLQSITSYVCAVHAVCVTVDPLLSAQAQQIITTHIKQSEYKAIKPAMLANELCDTFPFIRSVTCLYKPNGLLHVELKTYWPWLQLDEEHIITRNNYVVDAALFEPYASVSLPKISLSLDDQKRLPHDVYVYMQSIEPELLYGSHIIWHHRHEILFAFDQRPMRLLCNDVIKPTHYLLHCCESIAQELADQTQCAQPFLADARFSDHIIVSKLGGKKWQKC